jgi:elongation factor Ts
MSTITAAAVNELRKKTDLPMMDCKKALTEANGDMDKAVEILRSQFAKATVKREGNETAEGRIGIFVDNTAKQATILEFRCESAPTAKNDRVIELIADLAKSVAVNNPADVAALLATKHGSATIKERIDEVVGVIREKMVAHKFSRDTGHVYGQYIHHDGSVGTLLVCKGEKASDEVMRDVSAHVAALNPQFCLTAEVPADLMAKEKELAMSHILAEPKNQGKPQNIIEKIAEGKMKTWLAETVLTEQPMANAAKYPNTTVGQALSKVGLTAVKFIRFKVGAI